MTKNSLSLPCFISAVIALASASTLYALPPLGLTQITASPTAQSKFEIIDGTAYLNSNAGLWKLDASGVPQQISVASNLTKVVKAADNNLYVASKTGDLYQVNSSLTFVDQYTYIFNGDDPQPLNSIIDIDSNLRGYDWFGEAARFNLDGSFEVYSSPAHSFFEFRETTPSGYAIGEGTINGTAGSEPILWNPDGSFNSGISSFSSNQVGTLRERLDGTGVNFSGIDSGEFFLGSDFYRIADNNGGELFGLAVVSHSDFVTLYDYNPGGTPNELFGFFPGIVPGFDNRAVPLLDLFPELATIDIDTIGAAGSVGGNLYLTISGSDGLYLFGAPDPSLVPEPTALVLLSLGSVCLLRRR